MNNMTITGEIRKKLFSLQDLKYKEFHSKLMPTVDSDLVIGIKVPVLRKLAREIVKDYKSEDIDLFIKDLPHKYYEENNLHGFIIEQISDFNKCICVLEQFLPFINNWATCDSISPKCFKSKKNRKMLLEKCLQWVKSDKTYTIRFGIEQLMKFYLDDDFSSEYLDIVASVKSDEYYVNMMRAWYFATALAKQYEAVFPFIAENKLDLWTHNKTIQKAVESYRISNEKKDVLRKYFIKENK